MSIPFFDGFDFYNQMGPGGRKWDQGSTGFFQGGRFGGLALRPQTGLSGGYAPAVKTFATPMNEMIVGFAWQVNDYSSVGYPKLTFYDGNTPQCSLWINNSTKVVEVRSGGLGTSGAVVLGSTGFVPPISLWFYLEMKVKIGSPGLVTINLNGTTIGDYPAVVTQQSGNASANRIAFSALGGFQQGSVIDDMYVINVDDGIGNIDFLGEVRVQTKYPDANGFQTDFFPVGSSNNSQNVNVGVTDYSERGVFNYSGSVGGKDLYSIGNFTISGQIFAVQENLSFRKDDVGNRSVAPLMRTASVNYTGTSVPCYSNYTYTGKVWENNPNTTLPWTLTDLNSAQFGITVTA
jgi:hypothetical protein